MNNILGAPTFREPSEKEIQELKEREINQLNSLIEESIELLQKGEKHMSFGNYQIFEIKNKKYLYCNTNKVAGLMDERIMSLFNPEIIKSNFTHNWLWDYYKEVEC